MCKTPKILNTLNNDLLEFFLSKLGSFTCFSEVAQCSNIKRFAVNSTSDLSFCQRDIYCVNCSLLLLRWLSRVIIHTLIIILPKRCACFTKYCLTLRTFDPTLNCEGVLTVIIHKETIVRDLKWSFITGVLLFSVNPVKVSRDWLDINSTRVWLHPLKQTQTFYGVIILWIL